MLNKPFTFAEIFSLKLENGMKINSIEIPRIQRDYAQGRSTPEIDRIRKKFLSALYQAVTGQSDPIKLDFVYGNVSNDGKLIPLDGQQRLTTLFLLHWYISKKEGISKDTCDFLTRFTYNTRFSSSDFCEKIISSSPDLSGDSVSDWLIDQNWYLYSWQYDPTVSAMLKMIDSIHLVFREAEEIWEYLIDYDNPPISFYFLPLENLGLTDTLYIKMNSRGKPLTNFEHFKAEFEGMIQIVSTELYNDFIHKADKDWVDMLWKYRGDDNAIDNEFMRYFRFVSEMLCYQNDIPVEEDDFDLANSLYSLDCDNAEEHLHFMFGAFDCWCGTDINKLFSDTFTEREYSPGKVALYSENTNLFLECCNKYGIRSGRIRSFTLNNTLLLFGVLTFQLNRSSITEEAYRERIRIMRNLVMNSPDEIRVERMPQLLDITKSIMIYGDISLGTSDFNEIQKKQELEKITWRAEHKDVVKELNRLEDHHLLQGTIAIIGLDNPEILPQRVESFYNVFLNKPDYIKISSALLSIKDYSQLHSFRFLLGSNLESTWRELFTESQQRKNFDRTRETVIALLDMVSSEADENIIDTHIDEYVNDKNTPKDWRYYFIKYPEMRVGQYGRYYWHNDPDRIKSNQYEVLMMKTESSLNGYHWDPFLYAAMQDTVVNSHCSLENYRDPLVIHSKNIRVNSTNSSCVFLDEDEKKVKEIMIPQNEDGIDLEDRVIMLMETIKQEIANN